MKTHDHNFKNLFLDFPKEALKWFFPQAEETWGKVLDVKFVRQEPKKHNLSDSSLELDMPILFKFKDQQLLLWLVEFQEDKGKFSIYKLLRYTTDLMEAHPKALVIPTVLFTDRKKWQKSVLQQLHTKFNDRTFLHFEYIFHKLFDLNARDYYNVNNPLVKILLPKMHYKKEERLEVIRQAYSGLFQLASSGLFDKYLDFIDIYAEIGAHEQVRLYNEIVQHKETAMLAQYIRDKGRIEGEREGEKRGEKRGEKKGEKRGEKIGEKKSLVAFVRSAHKQGVPVSTISKIVHLEISMVNSILNNEDIDIPLHLLDTNL
ncbi:MAG: Rpn family recombination-promoting nuclease/putative transposase [Desulfobacterium sp.]|jgi:predicted transposase YdaD|nr:Rpn family recombination-promoting nuclease/putative transposase [Desulfobacterium sp.]